MRRITLACAAALTAACTLAAATIAEAAPYHVIIWHDTGFCQVWDDGLGNQPWPSNYSPISQTLFTYNDAIAYKSAMVRNGTCSY